MTKSQIPNSAEIYYERLLNTKRHYSTRLLNFLYGNITNALSSDLLEEPRVHLGLPILQRKLKLLNSTKNQTTPTTKHVYQMRLNPLRTTCFSRNLSTKLNANKTQTALAKDLLGQPLVDQSDYYISKNNCGC